MRLVYAEFDGMLVDAVRTLQPFASAERVRKHPAVETEARRLQNLTGAYAFSIVENRMQSLRRAGKVIWCSSYGWEVTT